jgi:hypothetical protein
MPNSDPYLPTGQYADFIHLSDPPEAGPTPAAPTLCQQNLIAIRHVDDPPDMWTTSEPSEDGKSYTLTLHYRLPTLVMPGTTIRFENKSSQPTSTLRFER